MARGRRAVAAYKHMGFGKYIAVDADGVQVAKTLLNKVDVDRLTAKNGKPILPQRSELPPAVSHTPTKRRPRVEVAAGLADAVRQLEEAEAKIRNLTESLAEATEARDEFKVAADKYYEWWQRTEARFKDETERARDYEKGRDNLQVQLMATNGQLQSVRDNLTEARLYAVQMRAAAFPRGPVFPWERP